MAGPPANLSLGIMMFLLGFLLFLLGLKSIRHMKVIFLLRQDIHLGSQLTSIGNTAPSPSNSTRIRVDYLLFQIASTGKSYLNNRPTRVIIFSEIRHPGLADLFILDEYCPLDNWWSVTSIRLRPFSDPSPRWPVTSIRLRPFGDSSPRWPVTSIRLRPQVHWSSTYTWF